MPTFNGMITRAERAIEKIIDVHRVQSERKTINKKLQLLGESYTTDEREQIKAYWSKYAKTDPAFQLFYSRVNGSFDVRYLPDDLYYTVIDPLYNDKHAFKFIDNKCYYDTYFPNTLQPKVIAKRINGYWIINGTITDLNSVVCEAKKSECIFMKVANNSCGGHGVKRFLADEITIQNINKALEKQKNDIVIQEKVSQHSILSKINPSAVNTVRIMTWIDREGKISVLSKVLRVGIGDAYVDNASSGGIVVGIDQENRLKEFAFRTSGKRYETHPTTAVEFKGIAIPGIDKAEEMTVNLAPVFPHHRLISWDICIDENELPILIELNMHHGELDFHQMTNGPLFGDRTEEMLNEVFHI